MIGYHRVKLENDGLNPKPTHVFVDGEEVHGVRGITYSQTVDTIPTVTMELIAIPEIESIADIHYSIRRTDIKNAFRLLEYALSDKGIFEEYKNEYNMLCKLVENNK